MIYLYHVYAHYAICGVEAKVNIKVILSLFVVTAFISACSGAIDRVEPTALPTETILPLKGEADVENMNEMNYIGNINSKKFHKKSCSTLPYRSNRVYFATREEAIDVDFVPCGRCSP